MIIFAIRVRVQKSLEITVLCKTSVQYGKIRRNTLQYIYGIPENDNNKNNSLYF